MKRNKFNFIVIWISKVGKQINSNNSCFDKRYIKERKIMSFNTLLTI